MPATCSPILTAEQEDEVVQWIEAHPMLYNPNLTDYNSQQMKYQLWEDKARELGIHVTKLQGWWLSMRSMFGRLSCDGPDQVTDRDRWVLTRFHFLRPYMIRTKITLAAASRKRPHDEDSDSY